MIDIRDITMMYHDRKADVWSTVVPPRNFLEPPMGKSPLPEVVSQVNMWYCRPPIKLLYN